MGSSKFLTLVYYTSGAGYSFYLIKERGFQTAILFFVLILIINIVIQFLAESTISYFDRKNKNIHVYELSQTIPDYWNTIVTIYSFIQLAILATLIFVIFKP